MAWKKKFKNKVNQPDEIQKEFWQYRRLWIISFLVLAAASFIFPRIPLLRGWEKKFAASSIELAKAEVPGNAIKTNNMDVVNIMFKPKFEIPTGLVSIDGAILVAAWQCNPMGDAGVCLRYMWNLDPLTMIISFKPKRTNKNFGPFTRTGWGGYYFVKKEFAAAAIGPFGPAEILAAWPYASEFVSHQKTK
jgi:hypothetical protein